MRRVRGAHHVLLGVAGVAKLLDQSRDKVLDCLGSSRKGGMYVAGREEA